MPFAPLTGLTAENTRNKISSWEFDVRWKWRFDVWVRLLVVFLQLVYQTFGFCERVASSDCAPDRWAVCKLVPFAPACFFVTFDTTHQSGIQINAEVDRHVGVKPIFNLVVCHDVGVCGLPYTSRDLNFEVFAVLEAPFNGVCPHISKAGGIQRKTAVGNADGLGQVNFPLCGWCTFVWAKHGAYKSGG